jgi:hypothetical protein
MVGSIYGRSSGNCSFRFDLISETAFPLKPLGQISALRKINTEPSIGASHQISVHFGIAVSEKKIFRN